MTRIEVPYSRVVTPGLIGDDVKGYKRAISRAAPDLYPWAESFTPMAGPFFVTAVKKYQKRVGLSQTGNVGPRTHDALELAARKGYPREHAFDARAVQLLTDFYEAIHVSPEQRIRNNMLRVMQFWYGYRQRIAYSQYRPFQRGRPPWVPSRWDCSGFVTCVYEAAGAANPNGRLWDGLGYTGTLMNRGTRCTLSDMELGDLIFYGYTTRNSPAFPTGSPTHVAGMYAGAGMVYSMGSYPMGFYKWNYRGVNHFRHYDVTP